MNGLLTKFDVYTDGSICYHNGTTKISMTVYTDRSIGNFIGPNNNGSSDVIQWRTHAPLSTILF